MESSKHQAKPLINLQGEKIALGPHNHDLLPLYLKWINDFDVTQTLEIGWRPMTKEAEEVWYERISKSGTDITFTIYERLTLRPIGNTELRRIDYAHGTAEFGVMIGEKDCWGKGFGTEAATLMLDYGFTGLGLHNIWLSVYASNERAIRAYSRAGFREIGRRREARKIGGQFYDIVLMDCLATEFESPLLRGKLNLSTSHS
jgi:RimJ/RimL family protein N-acetyltransferase